MMIKNEGVLLLLLSLAIDAEMARSLWITLLDDRAPYNSTEEDFLLMIQTADTFVANNHKDASFHVSTI